MTVRFSWFFILTLAVAAWGQSRRPQILQEKRWPDVKVYLDTCDMVLIPLGSTEQHGPHLPLGTDFYEAMALAEAVSARTGVLVAPLVLAGYSPYHMGFSGTLTLSPETLGQVLWEGCRSLIGHGFRRFLILNYHGGNDFIQERLIVRINHETEATAVAVGLGSSVQPADSLRFFDWHAGVSETSLMRYLRPDLVRMDLLVNPVIRFTPQMDTLRAAMARHPELYPAWDALFTAPPETGKGGSSHELSENGIWSLDDVRQASAQEGRRRAEAMIDAAARLVCSWKKYPSSTK